MSIIYSHNVTFDSIFVNNTGNVVSSCESRQTYPLMIMR